MSEYRQIDRMRDVPSSGTIKLASIASEMDRIGDKRVIKLTLGEPDMKTPEFIIEGAKRALDEGKTHYTNFKGIDELREGVAAMYRGRGLDVGADNVLITPTKTGIFGSILTQIEKGAEVVIISPCWVSYQPMITMAGGIARYARMVKIGRTFGVDEEGLKAALSPRTRMILINTPNNPTGHVMSLDELKLIADLAIDHDLLVVSDEVYENLVYDNYRHYSIATLPGMWERTITVSGLSKSFAMTGWRVGWTVAQKGFMEELWKFQQHTLTCVTSFAQYGALEIFKRPDEARRALNRIKSTFAERRDMFYKLLSEIDGLEISKPEGTFYMFPEYRSTKNSEEFTEWLLKTGRIAVTPGKVFGPGGEWHIRLSFANSNIRLLQGAERIREAFNKLRTREQIAGAQGQSLEDMLAPRNNKNGTNVLKIKPTSTNK